MGGCSSSTIVPSNPSATPDEEIHNVAGNISLGNNFHRAIIEKDHDRMRDLIKRDGSKIITKPDLNAEGTQQLVISAQTVLVTLFEKLIAIDDLSKKSSMQVTPEPMPAAIADTGNGESPSSIDAVDPPAPKADVDTKDDIKHSPAEQGSAVDHADKYALHAAARVGDVEEILVICMGGTSSLGSDQLWIRDEFDNIPLYYTCLNGHPICCAWLLLAMRCGVCADRFAAEVPLIEMERFVINALNSDIKDLLQSKVDCKGKP